LGKRPHTDSSNWLATGLGYRFLSFVVQIRLAYDTVDLLCRYALQILCAIFGVIDYLAVLISVISFTSFLVFYALYSRRLLHNCQLSVTLQKLNALHRKIAATIQSYKEDARN
jgi:hypothetical protein